MFAGRAPAPRSPAFRPRPELELPRFRGDLILLRGGGIRDVEDQTAVPAAFRQQMVELVRYGRTPGDLAREFEPSAQAIRTWVAQADRDAGTRNDGLRTEELEEVRRLRREVRRLREERDILANPSASSALWPRTL